MDAAGALFLPCAGARTGTEVNGINYYGGYWSTDYFDQNTASALVFDETSIDVNGLYRSQGYSVRLVQDAEPQAIDQYKATKDKVQRSSAMACSSSSATAKSTTHKVHR